jgi:nucleoid-associated protein EbfC
VTDPFDLQAVLAQAQEMQQRMLDAQQAAAGETVEGTSGGGVVRITATGTGEFVSVHIDPAAIDPDDTGLLEDLVLAALHDVAAHVSELNQQRMEGLGLGGLFGAEDG